MRMHVRVRSRKCCLGRTVGSFRVTLVANQFPPCAGRHLDRRGVVPAGMNVADRKIVELVQEGDLVITADIPLAADVVGKGARRSIHAENCTRTRTLANDWQCVTSSIRCAELVK